MEFRDYLTALCAELDSIEGWDFSRVSDYRGAIPWDYADVVRPYASGGMLLDMGTGGVEVLLTFAAKADTVIAIDISMDMLMSAQRNLHGASQGDVALVCADNLALSFKDNSFDLVCSRHASFSAEEVARVLRPGGHFITQQVGRNNTESVLSSFGWNAASFGPDHWGPTLSEAADSFRKLGMEVLRQEEYDVEYWFRDLVSLVLWLRSVPLPEPFDVGLHWRGVKTLVDEHTTSQGIKTNEHRTLLVCESAL